MSTGHASKSAASAQTDERLKRVSGFSALVRRPELGAVAGLILVTIC